MITTIIKELPNDQVFQKYFKSSGMKNIQEKVLQVCLQKSGFLLNQSLNTDTAFPWEIEEEKISIKK